MTRHVVSTLRAAGCVFAEEEAALLIEEAGADHVALEQMVLARTSGQPLEHVLGWAAFGGLRLAVGPGVFVPRRRTELLAEAAYRILTDGPAAARQDEDTVVVELCCGVAPVTAVLQRTPLNLAVYAVDIDPMAVSYAERNLVPPAVALVGDLYEPLPAGIAGRIDVLAANAPYVPTEAIPLMPREARDHEPLLALDGGSDGADLQRKIIADAPQWLRPGAHLLIESGREQSVITAGEMRARGLVVEVVVDDDLDATVVIGRLPSARQPSVQR